MLWSLCCLNEVQFPKELQLALSHPAVGAGLASMKCSSRRNCNDKAVNAQDKYTVPQ